MEKPPTLVCRNYTHWYGETTHTGMVKPPTLVWRNHPHWYRETTHTGMEKPPTLVWRNHPHWYGETTHTGMEKPPTLVWRNHPHWYGKTCKKRYGERVLNSFTPRPDAQISDEQAPPFLRSRTEPRKRDDKQKCFFCNKEGSQGDKLFTVLYDKSGNRRGSDLKRDMEIKNDEKFRVKLSEAIDPNDALAIDVMYHHGC